VGLQQNSDFYLGALAACVSLTALCVLYAFSLSSRRHARERLFSPIVMFLVPYLAFLGLSYARPFIDIQFVPSVQPAVYNDWAPGLLTVGLYLLGGLAVLAGYICFPATSRRYGQMWEYLVRPLFTSIKSLLGARKIPFFVWSVVILWGIGLAANLLIFVQLRAIPLFDIEKRTLMDPKITFLTQLEPLIVLLAPFVSGHGTTLGRSLDFVRKRWVFGLLVVVSLAGLTLLGARNLPAKLGIGLFLFWFLRPARQPGTISRKLEAVAALGLVLFVTIGIAGALTKVEIYNLSIQRLPEIVFGAPVADSIGNLYSFEVLVDFSGLSGHFHGNLMRTTLLSYIPGREELYANYIVGQIVGFSPEQLNSISSTFNGPALLDFGILGVLGNSFLFGLALGYGWAAVKASSRNLGAFALFLGTMILDIHLGTYNIWSFFMLIVLVVTAEYNRVP